MVYAELLGKKIDEHQTRVFLVNTGWVGGRASEVDRMKLSYTRAMVRAALNGDLDNVEYEADPILGVFVPKEIPASDVPRDILSPRSVWKDKEAYEKQARELAARFIENFKKFGTAKESIIAAGPKA